MPKFIAVIEGCAEVIEAETTAKAEAIAYEIWRVGANWYVEEATKENLANWGLETSDED